MSNSLIQVENQVENNEVENVKRKGRPRLTEEEKLIRKQERLEYQRKYNMENKERLNQKNLEYARKNKDKVNESNRKYYSKNKDKFIENHKTYRQKKKEENEKTKLLIEKLTNQLKQFTSE
jgi:hypothetical protein